MPESRTRPHIPATHSSLTPQMIGIPITTRQPKEQQQQEQRKQVVDKDGDDDTEDTEVEAAAVEVEDYLHEKQTTLPSANALFGSWYNDFEALEIKHMIIFNQDGTGSLKSQGNVDGEGAKLLQFQYTVSEDMKTLLIHYLPLSPLISNPFEKAKYVQSQDIPTETVTLPFQVYEQEKNGDSYSFSAPSGKTYEPTYALEFEASPWPLGLFPDRVRYYGALRRVRANKTRDLYL